MFILLKINFLRKIDINFIKTITWLNKIEEDLFLMVSLPRTGQNFYLDVLSDYCIQFVKDNINFDKEIMKQQFIVHDKRIFINLNLIFI